MSERTTVTRSRLSDSTAAPVTEKTCALPSFITRARCWASGWARRYSTQSSLPIHFWRYSPDSSGSKVSQMQERVSWNSARLSTP